MANEKSNIFCPNCGANNKIEQSFCRFCGLNLEDSIKTLRAQFAGRENTEHFIKLGWAKQISDYLSISLITAIVIILFSTVYGYFTTGEFQGRRLWVSAIFLIILSQSGLNYFRRKSTAGYWEESVEKRAADKELKPLETNKLIEDRPFESVSSVTENSTRLLFAENKTTKLE